MKKRNPIAVFFLSIITLGIYDIYWLVKTKTVLNKETKVHVPTIWLLFIPGILLGVGYGLLIGGGVSNHNTGYGSSTSTIAHPGVFFSGVGLIVVGFIAAFTIGIYWLFRFSQAVDEYTNGKMNTAVSFLILWLVHFIGVALIQDAFNNMPGVQTGQPVAAAPLNSTSPPAEQYSPPPNDKPNQQV
ncbi:MAG TPA: DUF4234 domain-containing protein [Candidatus Sulfotelmatobacter sp.]|nr:DUF4234 domain-containing protein [Candidatus Sulfotelmatobacter sp.]